MSVRLLFLNRDGTLNRSLNRRLPNRSEEVELLSGIGPILSRDVRDGWRLVIVTNQGGVARGYLSEAQARAVLQRVVDLLPVPIAMESSQAEHLGQSIQAVRPPQRGIKVRVPYLSGRVNHHRREHG